MLPQPDFQRGVIHQHHDEILAECELADAPVGHDYVLEQLRHQGVAELLVHADEVRVEGVEIRVDAGESQAGPVVL